MCLTQDAEWLFCLLVSIGDGGVIHRTGDQSVVIISCDSEGELAGYCVGWFIRVGLHNIRTTYTHTHKHKINTVITEQQPLGFKMDL